MFRRSRALARLDADIQDHLEREIQDNLDRGMTPAEARRRALITFGNGSPGRTRGRSGGGASRKNCPRTSATRCARSGVNPASPSSSY